MAQKRNRKKTEAATTTSEAVVPESEAPVVSGFTVTNAIEAAFPDDVKKVFDEAAAQYNGGTLIPVALLATQVVSGTNYAFLVQDAIGEPQYQVMIAWQDPEGNVTLTSIQEIDLAADEFGGEMPQGVTGGWQIADQTYAAPNKTDMEVLSNATEGSENYELVANLATQIVAGTNYKLLVKVHDVQQSGDPATKLFVKTIYQDLDGKCEVLDSVEFNVADYNK